MANNSERKTTAPDPVKEAEAILAEAAAMKAEAEAMKAEIEAEKEKIKAEKAKKALRVGVEPDKAQEPDDGDELVEVRLFKDNGAYKDDLTVGVNGEIIKIQRGKAVKIKKKFLRVIEQSNLQAEQLANLIDEKTSEYEAEVKRIAGE